MSFVRYTPEDSVVSTETVVRPMWSGDTNTLTTFYTSSVITSSFYTNVYADYPGALTVTTSSVQFAIQYGNKYGSGSNFINDDVTTQLPDNSYLTPTRVVYGQYRTLLLGTETGDFTFGGNLNAGNACVGVSQVGVDNPDGIYIINIARNRYKEHIQPGSLTLTLSTGLAGVTLTDNSQISSTNNYTTAGTLYYTLISGSNGVAYAAAPSASVYGYLFPDNDIIILNPTALSKSILEGGISYRPSLTDPTSLARANNIPNSLFNIISSGSYFQLQSAENVSSHYFFTRVKNQEFNYTTNPSIIDSNGNLLYTTLINNPQTFITTVGLYNDSNELLAVAKLSRPLVKDFTKEALIKVKLDY
jgi:hypothetical protein